MASIFSKIIDGQIPCHKVAESETCIAFLDIRPLVEGHTLIVPKMEVDRLFDLSDKSYQELFAFAKKVAHAIKASYPCDRVGVAVVGLEVPHAHIHLMPISAMSDMDFANPKVQLDQNQLIYSAQLIASNI